MKGFPLILQSRADADAILVAPATADFLHELAHSAADDLLSTLCVTRQCPLLDAPAMNRQVWWNAGHGATRADGIAILGPDTGELACKEDGEGRMLEPEQICAAFAPAKIAGGQARAAHRRTDGGTSETLANASLRERF